MTSIVQIVFISFAIALIVIVLLQQSKSSGMGSLGGGGGTVFGAKGAGSFLYKTTRFLAAGFLFSALLLGYVLNKNASSGNILQKTPLEAAQKVDAALDVPAVKVDNVGSAANTENLDTTTKP